MPFTFGYGKAEIKQEFPRQTVVRTHCDYSWNECRPCKICNRDTVKCPVCGESI